MDFFWQQLTLSSLPLKQYITSSYLYRLSVGLLSSWRQTSILLRWGDAIAVALLSIVYILAPFVSNALIGLLLVACVGFWLLLTASDEPTDNRSEEHTSELQSQFRISYAVFCLKKKMHISSSL